MIKELLGRTFGELGQSSDPHVRSAGFRVVQSLRTHRRKKIDMPEPELSD